MRREVNFNTLKNIEIYTKNVGDVNLINQYSNYDSTTHDIDKSNAKRIRLSKQHFVNETDDCKLFSIEIWIPDNRKTNTFYVCLEIVKDNEIIHRYHSQNSFTPISSSRIIALFNFTGETIPSDYDYVDLKAVATRDTIPLEDNSNLVEFRCSPIKIKGTNSYAHADDTICGVFDGSTNQDYFPAFRVSYNKNDEKINSSFVTTNKTQNKFNSISLFRETVKNESGKFSPKFKTVFVDDSMLFTSSNAKTNQIQYQYFRNGINDEERLNSEIKNSDGSLYGITIDTASISNISNYGDLTNVFKEQNNITNVNISLNDNEYLNHIFHDCKNLTTAKVYSPLTRQAQSAFNGCNNLEELILIIPNAETASSCCYNCVKLRKLIFNFDSLAPGPGATHYILQYCGALEEVYGSAKQLENQSGANNGLFEGLGKITKAYLKLPSLSSGEYLFASGADPSNKGNCGKLDVDSIIYIANYIKEWTDETSHPIRLGIQIDKTQWEEWDGTKNVTLRISSSDDVNNLIKTKPYLQNFKDYLIDNGWTVNFKTEDNPTVTEYEKIVTTLNGTNETRITKCTDDKMIAEYHAVIDFLKSKGWTVKLITRDVNFSQPDISPADLEYFYSTITPSSNGAYEKDGVKYTIELFDILESNNSIDFKIVTCFEDAVNQWNLSPCE